LTLNTPFKHKNRIIGSCSSLVQTESGAAVISGKVTCAKLVRRKLRREMLRKTTLLQIYLATSNLHGNKWETTQSHARKDDSAANRTTNTSALRIIIDFH
jgi:hypothetical protein